MKGLLHSKRFRKNLSKWLFMYVGCMALLTTVITYSKYITQLQASDSARVAKFAIDVYNYNCTESIKDNCNKDSYRSTSTIDYYFIVDTKEMEVKTDVYLTLFINNNFKLASDLIEIGESGEQLNKIEILDKKLKDVETSNGTYKFLNVNKNSPFHIEAGNGSIKKYKVSLQYNGENYANYYGEGKEIIRVGYSATQVR